MNGFKFCGLQVNEETGKFDPCVFCNGKRNIDFENGKDVLNVSDYVYQTITLLIMEKIKQSNNKRIDYANTLICQIVELEEDIIVNELSGNDFLESMVNNSIKETYGFEIIMKVAEFLNE